MQDAILGHLNEQNFRVGYNPSKRASDRVVHWAGSTDKRKVLIRILLAEFVVKNDSHRLHEI